MSNLTALGLILVTLLAGYAVIAHASNTLNRRADMIVVGLVDGVPVSKKHRYLMLFHIYLSQLGSVIALSAILAVGYVRIADNLDDPGVRNLAYLVAGLAAFAAINWLLLGTSYLIHCWQVLRQANGD